MIAGVIIDAWKLSIFRDQLVADNFIYTQVPHFDPGMVMLKVECDSADHLRPTIEKAAERCTAIMQGGTKQ